MLLALTLSSLLLTARPSVATLQEMKDGQFNPVCSAVVLTMDTHPLIVTEEHCLTAELPMAADTVPLKEVLRYKGFVAFRAQGRSAHWRPIRLSRLVPRAGETTYAAGFAYTDFFTMTEGTLAGYGPHEGEDMVWLDIEVIGGMSGGPILDREGRLLTLVRLVRSDGFGSPNGLAGSGHITTFRDFLAQAFRAPE